MHGLSAIEDAMNLSPEVRQREVIAQINCSQKLAECGSGAIDILTARGGSKALQQLRSAGPALIYGGCNTQQRGPVLSDAAEGDVLNGLDGNRGGNIGPARQMQLAVTHAAQSRAQIEARSLATARAKSVYPCVSTATRSM